MNKKEKYILALAGLFHDIGKLIYRAVRETTTEEEKNRFGYAHAVLSAKWIEKNKYIFEKIEKGLTDKLINWGSRHHNPTEELESRLMQVADWYSSAHDREKILKDELNIMHSVFERIHFNISNNKDTAEEKKFGIYKPSILELKKGVIFPKILSGFIENNKINYFSQKDIEKVFDVSSSKDIFEALKKEYDSLLKNFEEEFKKYTEKNSNSLESFFNFSYYLLQKYLWSVPASIWSQSDKNNHYPDISLFDHSRVLSAIATSLYDYSLEKGITKPKKDSTQTFDEEEAFLLIEGDIGGIQKFLFNIYKSSETSEAEFSIAKALRGRSFFLSMISEIFARYILDKLGYPLTNALYIGGGKFQLLIGNTKENLEKLTQIEKEINQFLFKEFHLDLNFTLAYISFKGKEFKIPNGFLNQVEALQVELDKKKKQKIGELIFEELETLEEVSEKDICPSCKSIPIEKNKVVVCKWCNLSQNIGNKIPKIKYIGFSIKDCILKPDIDLGQFGKVYLFNEPDRMSKEILLMAKEKGVNEILVLNSTEFNEFVNGFKFLGNTVPLINSENKNIFKQLADEEIKNSIEEDNVLPFEVLVKFAQGDKKLGFFRADVDNLGLILSDGLRTHETGNEDESIYTISRIATLSRMLDLFFSGYLNKIAEEITKDYLDSLTKEIENLDNKLKNIVNNIKEIKEKGESFINSLIYIVYSGGDDLFIIAPYNLALEFAKKVREEFTEFTAKNPEFGLSGGLLIANHNLPINLVAKYAEQLEDKAKTGSKDKIAIFKKAYKWKNFGIGECSLIKCKNKDKEEKVYFDELEKFINNLEYFYKKEVISRRFLYNLLILHSAYVKEENKTTKIEPVIYPKLHYQIARNIKNKDDENVRKKLIIPLLDMNSKEIIKNLDTIVSLVLMRTRKGG
jgi:CRISPR-associated protein Csm1